ncbi:MAG: DUF4845 domain-containing protein [Burkholderiales bacterium]
MGRDRGAQGQRGISIIGFLFVAAVIVIFALVGFRMIPAYIEWYTVQRALESAVADAGNDPSLNNIRRAMERKLSADYADAVTAKDVNVVKEGNTITAQVSWQKVLPMVANVSILIDFEAHASR